MWPFRKRVEIDRSPYYEVLAAPAGGFRLYAISWHAAGSVAGGMRWSKFYSPFPDVFDSVETAHAYLHDYLDRVGQNARFTDRGVQIGTA